MASRPGGGCDEQRITFARIDLIDAYRIKERIAAAPSGEARAMMAADELLNIFSSGEIKEEEVMAATIRLNTWRWLASGLRPSNRL